MELPIRLGDTYAETAPMIETTVDYWTCIDLAQALEQTMRNDLWSTAERIAETALRITNKPDKLVIVLKKFEIRQAAVSAASNMTEAPVSTISMPSTVFSKAG